MKFNLKSHGGGRLVPSRNKGSFSMELIAIVVCVILVAVLALRTFGGQISNTTNETTNTVEALTSTVLNSPGPGGSGGNGGNSSTPGIDMSNINSNGVVGDFSTKGNLVTINGTQYRVLAVDGTMAKVMSMESAGNSVFGASQIYANSTLDQAMTNYYNGLPTPIKSAIVSQTINQTAYSNPTTTANRNGEFAVVGSRYVYALDVDDVIEYLGERYTANSLMEMFFDVDASTVSGYNIWLRSAQSSTRDNVIFVVGDFGMLTFAIYTNNFEVRPAFVIDLSLLS